MYSLAEENYLKALLTLSADSEEVGLNELAKALNIKMPTATSMMKKLAGKQLVHYERYRPLQLTEQGRKEAALIVRKHRLTEMFLVEKMGFGWDEVHEIAEQLEHLHAPRFFEQMDIMLGHPTIDPHGSPIPDSTGRMASEPLRTLSDCLAGETVKLLGVSDSGASFLQYLNARHIRLGLKLKVESVESFDGAMTLRYKDHPAEVLSQTVCQRLLVS